MARRVGLSKKKRGTLYSRTDPDFYQMPERRDPGSADNPGDHGTYTDRPSPAEGPPEFRRANGSSGNMGVELRHRSDRGVIRLVENPWSWPTRVRSELGRLWFHSAS